MTPVGDIRVWHLQFAVLVAATIHVVIVTAYLNLPSFRTAPPPPPPTIVLRDTPPPAKPTPPDVKRRLPAVPITRPQARTPPPTPAKPVLPQVTLPKSEEPPIPVEPEPFLDFAPEPLPIETPAPVPKPKPAAPPKQVAETKPLEKAATPPSDSAESKDPPRTIEDLTPSEKQTMLEEYYLDRKENWNPLFENRDHAWAWLDLGVIDPTAPETQPEVYLEGLNQFMDVHGPQPGEVDPTAKESNPELYEESDTQFAAHDGPLTVQEIEATLKSAVSWGTQQIIGRNVEDVKDLTAGERQALIDHYYRDDPRLAQGIIDPTSPPDMIALCSDEEYGHLAPTQRDEFCNLSPPTKQEIEETLKKMLRERQSGGASSRTPTRTRPRPVRRAPASPPQQKPQQEQPSAFMRWLGGVAPAAPVQATDPHAVDAAEVDPDAAQAAIADDSDEQFEASSGPDDVDPTAAIPDDEDE